MKIDVKHIAELSRISLSEEEFKKFIPQMETILDSVSVLGEVDTCNVQPMKNHVSLKDAREDMPEKGLEQDEVIRNAPHKEDGFVKVYGKVFGSIEES